MCLSAAQRQHGGMSYEALISTEIQAELRLVASASLNVGERGGHRVVISVL